MKVQPDNFLVGQASRPSGDASSRAHLDPVLRQRGLDVWSSAFRRFRARIGHRRLKAELQTRTRARHTPSNQRGIALVVTLILLSVVTFLAVAFLFLSRRERGAVTTQLDMTTARLAAEAATERAKIEVISGAE